jgi:hypothetical protein
LVVTQLQHVLDVVCNLLTNKSVHCWKNAGLFYMHVIRAFTHM